MRVNDFPVEFIRQFYEDRRKGFLSDYVTEFWDSFFYGVANGDMFLMSDINELIDSEDNIEMFMEKYERLMSGSKIADLVTAEEDVTSNEYLAKKVEMLESTITELMIALPTMQ